MPSVQLKTNLEKEKLTKDVQQRFFVKCVELFQTSEPRVTVSFEGDVMMCQGGSFEPCFEILAVSGKVDRQQHTDRIIYGLREFLNEEFGIPNHRIVLRFCNIEAHQDSIYCQ